tara:strand:- start:68 stop:757 length:690 start_codon:yes stop_codon:yes gene_type:complete
MAEVGAGDGIIVGPGGPLGMGGTGGGGTTYMFRQFGLAGYGPVSFGGENQGVTSAITGQSINQQSFFFDGIKGAYNANINQLMVNSITEIGPTQAGNTILPYVLYGMSQYTPSPLVGNISLHDFLDEREGVGGLATPISHRRSTDSSFGGFISSGMTNSNVTQPLLQNSGPSKLSEIMDSVPHDPLVQQGGQGSSINNTGPLGVGIGLTNVAGNNNIVIIGMYNSLMGA